MKRDLGVATIDNGTPGDGFDTLTAAQARLACTARIIPAVLGGDSEILDLGRGQRLFTKAQRRALSPPSPRPRLRHDHVDQRKPQVPPATVGAELKRAPR
ncbi:hypothetical protein [Nocardioides gilvus]|uniref:hypothetical protein n=1 Tax=Nocardioides gilvus TaxID=1735589 RepID=UPI0013A54CF8|nr:hypothetical protein [Nocardioides gilvus]